MKIRKVLASILLAFAMFNCGGGKEVQSEQTCVVDDSLKNVLINRLRILQDRKLIAFGHHDDPAYGVKWEYVPGGSDVKDVCGDYPAIFDWDLAYVEQGHAVQIDSVPFEFINEHVAKHHKAGGINTFSWHVDNPVTRGTAWDTADNHVIAKCLKPGQYNDTLVAWIGRTADYIGNLKDEDGNRIPVVFRPWHEHTGSWFWWGADWCTPEEYKALWKLTRDIFDQKGIDNVAWAYSPGSVESVEEYLERYPGDQYVDIMGVDTYMGGAKNEAGFTARMRKSLGILQEAAAKHLKVMALTETGHETLYVTDWYTRLLYPIIIDYPVAYMVVWRNSSKILNHFYVPYPGHPAAADFKQFAEMPNIAMLKDMPK